jgi:superkiller protein 3
LYRVRHSQQTKRTKSGIKSIKATSLVHLSLPKYHSLASAIINEVLLQFPTNVPCLLARAFILQAEQKWREANAIYLHAADLLSQDSHDRSRAIEEAAWCQYHCGEQSAGLASLQRILAVLSNVVGKESDRARCLWRIGQCYWGMNGVFNAALFITVN